MRPLFWLALFVFAALGSLGCGYAFIANGFALSGHFSAERREQLEAGGTYWLIGCIGFALATVAASLGLFASFFQRRRPAG